MEMSKFLTAQFQPLVIEYDSYEDNRYIMAYNPEFVLGCGMWEMRNGVCIIPNLCKIMFTFDGDITSKEFDPSKSSIYTIVCTRLGLMDEDGEVDESTSKLIWRQIINIFTSDIIKIPPELNITKLLDDNEASFIIIDEVTLFPLVLNGKLTFDADRIVAE